MEWMNLNFMKLRTELLKLVTPEDVMKQALENLHRYSANPTFSEIGRPFIGASLVNYRGQRARLLVTAVGHFIAGTLGQEDCIAMIERMSYESPLKEGLCVKTLKGILKGIVIGFSEEGNVLWQPVGMKNPLTATPNSLLEDSD